MATYVPISPTPLQFEDEAGLPLTGGSLEFYLETTSTATELYSDNAGTSIGTSITLNAAGYPESGGNVINLFKDASYAIKIVLKDAVGATIWTSDTIPATSEFDSTSAAKLSAIEALADVTDATNVAAAGAVMADGSVSMSGNLTFGSTTFPEWSVADGLTASTTQTQAGGLALVNRVNRVSTVANTNDAVTLPTAAAGLDVVIINDGANTLQVFPAADDTIDEAAADASMTIAAGDQQIFQAVSAVSWKTLVESGTALSTVGAATYTVLDDDGIVNVTYTATGAVTVTLPTAGAIINRKLRIKDAGGNAGTYNITIDTEGAETIDGAATQVLSGDYNSISLYSDGTNWFIY